MNTLAEILSSNTRAEFFRLMFGLNQKEYYLRELAKCSGMAIGTIQQEALKLENLGLIHKRRDGNRTYFRANKGHPIYMDIHRLVLKTTGLRDVLRSYLPDNSIQFAFVFGSIATNTEKPDSDIDLFVVGDIGLRGLSKYLTEPGQIIGREINSYSISTNELNKKIIQNDHFISAIINSQKLFIKGDENEFEKLVEEWLAEVTQDK
ncbi:MAG: nucleotidyltransferase domain-containing protein [Candidatus Marinimicrobia bacterium]|nr:nucleotidyltransferase domain-containing protein [Candidatus Neomarinimicrobiota bacterium]